MDKKIDIIDGNKKKYENKNEKMVTFWKKFEKNFRRLAFFLYQYSRGVISNGLSKVIQDVPEMKGYDDRKRKFGTGDGLAGFFG